MHWEGGMRNMKVQVYLVDMVSEAPMGAEARLNGSSTIAPIKNHKRLYWTSICPVSGSLCRCSLLEPALKLIITQKTNIEHQ